MNKRELLAALFAGIIISLPVEAKLYKWVDDQGVTHYGETIPPEYAGKSRSELDKSGREKESAKAVIERPSEQDEEKKREANKAAEEQRRFDRTILDTYTSVKEIELARTRNLQQVDARINTLNSSLNTANANLVELQKEADSYAGRNKPVPPSLQQDMLMAQERVAKLNRDMEKPKAEQNAINARYDAYKVRFIELTGQKE